MLKDPVLDACAERCAEFGDPPCHELDRRNDEPFVPCADCLRACGLEVPDPIDPRAVIEPLL
jgi:hypothetical protein